MNDFDPALDEIVSAYVDDAATPAERARVESDPALLERVAAFHRLRDALSIAPADDDVRNTLIARALADTAPPVATVHPLRSRRLTAVGPIAAAAAIIALFFGLGTWLVASQDNNDARETTAAVAPAISPDAFGSKDAAGLAAGTTAAANSTARAGAAVTVPTGESAKAPPISLGRFDDVASLRAALIAPPSAPLATAPGPATTSLDAQATSCPRTDIANASTYTATLQGRPVTVLVAGTRADVIDDATCARTTLDLTSR